MFNSCRENKTAGEKIEEGAKKVGEGVEEGAKKVGNDIEKGVKKAGDKIEDGAEKAGNDIKEGAKKVGDKVELKDVLFASANGNVKIGAPNIDGAVVTAEIVEQLRGEKIIVFKKKRRKDYRRKQGHRQDLTNLKIKEITL